MVPILSPALYVLSNRLGLISSESFFCSFMDVHAQAMTEYRGCEMSTEVVVDGNLWTEIVDCTVGGT